MKLARRFALAATAALLGVGVVGMAVPAHADSAWQPRPGQTQPSKAP